MTTSSDILQIIFGRSQDTIKKPRNSFFTHCSREYFQIVRGQAGTNTIIEITLCLPFFVSKKKLIKGRASDSGHHSIKWSAYCYSRQCYRIWGDSKMNKLNNQMLASSWLCSRVGDAHSQLLPSGITISSSLSFL